MNGCSPGTWRIWFRVMVLPLPALVPAFFLSAPMPPEQGVPLLWGLSFSAGRFGIPLTLLALLSLAGFPLRRLPVMLLPLLVLLAAGSWCNEHLLKPWLGEPRPNIQWLASEASGRVLGEGAPAFYAAGDKAVRGRRLAQALEASPLRLPALVRRHWIAETGHGFPSGHAFASTLLGGGLAFWLLCLERRRWLVFLILGWMVAVDWSRLLLGVHQPEDVLAGAALGLVMAAMSVGSSLVWWRRPSGPP